jgi:hypothetical protein
LSDPEAVTRRWLRDCVLALELCPFAAPVLRDSSLRIAVSKAVEHEEQLRDFLAELDLLQNSPEQTVSTTLLVYPGGPAGFEDFLDLVEDAEDLLERAGLEGVIQLAHFHPRYLFAGEPPEDLSHYTNRSPLPVLHLLRESTVTRALCAYSDPGQIPVRNIETLRSLGREEVRRRWQALQAD